LRAREGFGCCFLCGGNEFSRHDLGRGGGGVRSALFHLAAVHAHADIVLTVDLDRSNVDDELRGHWRMSFTGVDLGAFYQKTVSLSRGGSRLLRGKRFLDHDAAARFCRREMVARSTP